MLKKYLSNRAVNAFSLHLAIYGASEILLIFFGAVFFLRLGLPLWAILPLWGTILVLRVPLRLLIIPFWGRVSPKILFMAGASIVGLSFLSLLLVQKSLLWTPLFILLLSLGESFYWTCYHFIFGSITITKHQGKQLTVRNVLPLLTIAFMPGIGGLISEQIGMAWLFVGSISLIVLSFIPLYWLPTEKPERPLPWRKLDAGSWFAGKSFAPRAVQYYSGVFLWSIIVYLFIGDLSEFGIVITIGLLLQAILHFVVGHLYDAGHGKRMLWSGTWITGVITAIQAAFIATPIGAVFTNAVGGLRDTLLFHTTDSVYYQQARKANDRFWYHFFGEVGWDLGAGIMLFTGGALIWSGIDPRWLMIIGIPGLLLHSVINAKKIENKG